MKSIEHELPELVVASYRVFGRYIYDLCQIFEGPGFFFQMERTHIPLT